MIFWWVEYIGVGELYCVVVDLFDVVIFEFEGGGVVNVGYDVFLLMR